MPRPVEYESLLARGALKAAARNEESIRQFIKVATELQSAARVPLPDVARFTLTYEGMFSVVMAVLEFHSARPGDTGGHRQIAIQRVGADLELEPAKFSALVRLHDARNRVTYRSAIPPIRKADADAMQAVLDHFLFASSTLMADILKR